MPTPPPGTSPARVGPLLTPPGPLTGILEKYAFPYFFLNISLTFPYIWDLLIDLKFIVLVVIMAEKEGTGE